MIFITLGSQKFQFNRLLRAMDHALEKGIVHEDVFAQIGYSDYEPKNFNYRRFLDRKEFIHIVSNSDIVITHGGTGAIVGALKQGKKVIAVPRRAKYGEHVDDHQFQIVKEFNDLNLLYECDDCDKLGVALQEVKKREFNKYRSNTRAIIESIEDFIREN